MRKSIIDIKYDNESEAQKLDIHYPDIELDSYPIIVFFHGGAFKIGDKGPDHIKELLKMLDRGYVVASVNYRLSDEAIFPSAVIDCKNAVKFLKMKSNEYKIDVNRFILWGASAGANLACMCALTNDHYSTKYLDYDSSCKVCVSWFGPMSFINLTNDAKELGMELRYGSSDDVNSPESLYIGQGIQVDTKKTELSNPATYIKGKSCPFFMQHGKMDNYVPYLQTVRLYNELLKVNDSNDLYLEIFDKASHGDRKSPDGIVRFGSDENLDKIDKFIRKYI